MANFDITFETAWGWGGTLWFVTYVQIFEATILISNNIDHAEKCHKKSLYIVHKILKGV